MGPGILKRRKQRDDPDALRLFGPCFQILSIRRFRFGRQHNVVQAPCPKTGLSDASPDLQADVVRELEELSGEKLEVEVVREAADMRALQILRF